MKNILAFFSVLLISLSANAYQLYTPKGTVDTNMNVDSAGAFLLQQDLISNANSSQPTRSIDFVVGRNPLVNNVLCDMWEGPTCIYVFPTGPIQMQVVSSSANDAAAGTGIQKVIIHYLDNLYVLHTETVTLNGLTPVTTVATNILRVNAFHAAQVGSGGLAAGNISLQAVGGAVTYGYISAGQNTARQAIYTIPAGHNGYMSHWQASSGTVTGTHFTRIMVRATSHDGVLFPGVFLVADEVGTLNGGNNDTLPIPIRFPATVDVKMSAISDASNANAVATGAVFGWIEAQ